MIVPFLRFRPVFRLASLAVGVLLIAASGRGDAAEPEITYPGEAFAKLDTFEGLNLEDADKLYGKEDYKGAYAAYKAYSFEFAKSGALPYVLLRMGRCLHKLEKRNAAIEAYQDVVDYFPDDIRYAAAALYYIGECHGENGDEANKTAAWAKMVKDDDYVSQPNSGTALTYLGTAMEKLGKFEEAAEYHWRTATAFLQSNPAAAEVARRAVISHYGGRSPNHEKLSEFYVAASGFNGRGENTGTPDEDVRYWSTVLAAALQTPGEAGEKEKACAYWGAKLGERFAVDDGLRKLWCDVQLVHEKNRESWLARMEKQFASKPVDIGRVLQWCEYYRGDPAVCAAFFKKHGEPMVAAMNNAEKSSLMNRLRHPLGMHEEARRVMATVNIAGMSDAELKTHAEFVGLYEPEEAVLGYFARMKDRVFAAKARFDYYHARSHRNPPFMEKALAEIPELLKSPQYADGLTWAKATLLQGLGRHEEAIEAFRVANRQPDSTWGISDSLVALKQFDQAVKTVSELESIGGAVASQAGFRVADIYRIAGDKAREVGQLRTVLRRYPKTTESAAAHDRLESYGVALVGGEAEAEE